MKSVKPPKKSTPPNPAGPPPRKIPPFSEKDTPQTDLGRLMTRLIMLASELTAPVPPGLTSAMRDAIEDQKQEVEIAMLGQAKLIEGFVTACARANLLSAEEYAQAEETVASIIGNPNIVRTLPQTAPAADVKEEGNADAPVVSIVPASDAPADGGAG